MTFREYALGQWKFSGLSAKCIYGVHVNNYQELNYPLDPDDLCRCIQALRFMFGDNDDVIIHHLHGVANYYKSDIWKRYAEHWGELLQLFFTEWENKSAPKTFAFMQKIQKGKFK